MGHWTRICVGALGFLFAGAVMGIAGCGKSTPSVANPSPSSPVSQNPSPPNIDSQIRDDGQSATNVPSGTSTMNGGKDTTSPQDKKALLASPPHNLESNRLYPLSLLQVIQLQIGDKKFPAWVMDTSPKQAEGMMYLTRKDIPKGHAMIFVFSKPQAQSFWMENTYIPLDIAFVAADGKVLNVAEGKPLDQTNLPSKGPCQYVIETYKGDAEFDGIKAGAMIKIPPNLAGNGLDTNPNPSGIPTSINSTGGSSDDGSDGS